MATARDTWRRRDHPRPGNRGTHAGTRTTQRATRIMTAALERIMCEVKRLWPCHVDHASREAIREEMTREDPDFRRVRDIQHDALQALTAKRAADGMAIQ